MLDSRHSILTPAGSNRYKARWFRAQTLKSSENQGNFEIERSEVLSPSLEPDVFFGDNMLDPKIYLSVSTYHPSRYTP